MERKAIVRAAYRVIQQHRDSPDEMLATAVADLFELMLDMDSPSAPTVPSPLEPAKRKGRPPGSRNRVKEDELPQPNFKNMVGEVEQAEQLSKIGQNQKPLIITADSPEAKEILNPTGGKIIKPIRLGPQGARRRPDPARDQWDLGDLMETVEANTPAFMEVVPEKLGYPVSLRRRVIRNDAISALKLVYELDGQKRPEGVQGEGWQFRTAGQESQISAINLDATVEQTFTASHSREIDFEECMDRIKFQAVRAFRPADEPIVNHTPVRRGHLTLQLEDNSSALRGDLRVRGAVSAEGVRLNPASTVTVQQGVSYNRGDLPSGVNPAVLVEEHPE
jgi:hypothetical protein